MAQARARKERTCPKLAHAHGRARLVVLACEVGGRWSGEALSHLHSLADAKVRDEPEDFREGIKSAWMRRSFSRDAALLVVTVWRPPQLRWSGTTGTRCSRPLFDLFKITEGKKRRGRKGKGGGGREGRRRGREEKEKGKQGVVKRERKKNENKGRNKKKEKKWEMNVGKGVGGKRETHLNKK